MTKLNISVNVIIYLASISKKEFVYLTEKVPHQFEAQ